MYEDVTWAAVRFEAGVEQHEGAHTHTVPAPSLLCALSALCNATLTADVHSLSVCVCAAAAAGKEAEQNQKKPKSGRSSEGANYANMLPRAPDHIPTANKAVDTVTDQKAHTHTQCPHRPVVCCPLSTLNATL